ncbi:uncharacterized protein LOC117932072 [Vitis riparia]|uniref:uncharacterized protein LOC117932072 n=1 Tax=Vitis riparia TaxID=96939 RepID=UPI00155B27B6|nr:uncharacterized protein LOC117932072 [Vitis riparia]
MVSTILASLPMAIPDRDSDGKNIVLLEVENRQTKLYAQLVRNITFYESAFRVADNKGNSALHVAATLRDHQPYQFAALQMQREIKCTSNSCSVVATVVTTVAFATTATPLGGMKEGSSRPNLEHHPGFIVFAISSLIALSFSLTSIVSFLAILTPRHRPKDFEKQLPGKFLYALTYLFISLAAKLVCFCAGHFFLMRDDLEHNAFLVYGIACLPVAYFAMKQFPFYIDLVLDTFLKAPRYKPSS